MVAARLFSYTEKSSALGLLLMEVRLSDPGRRNRTIMQWAHSATWDNPGSDNRIYGVFCV